MMRITGRLFDPADRGRCAVSVEGGLVTRIEAEPQALPGDLGGPGAMILPGLIDAQVNGAFGIDFSDPAADIDAAAARLPGLGVTAFVPTLVTAPAEAYAPALANLRPRARPGAARILRTHIEGPFLNPARAGTHERAWLRMPDVAVAAAWLEAGDVGIVTMAPELPGAEPVISYLAERGVVVSMGHSDARWAQAAVGAAAGMRCGTHLFNGMRPFRHRDPGITGFLLASSLPVGFIGDGVHVAFETIGLLVRIKGPDELILVTDALAGLGVPPGPFRISGQEYVSDGIVGRLPDGTLSGSLLPLNRALRNLARTGIGVDAAVRMATSTPARLLGMEDTLGHVAVGRPADLAVLDGEWDVLLTLVDGAVAFRREEVEGPAGAVA